MGINPDNLIPPDSELGQLLAQWAEDNDTRTWHIANVTNELIEELEGGAVTRADVYKAVAARCKGRKVNTIRRWAEVASDFDKDTQEQYAQLLSFEHFKASRRLFQEGHTPTLTYGLEWCIQANDDKLAAGRFKTVGQLLNEFLPEFNKPNAMTVWKKCRDALREQFSRVDDDEIREAMLSLWATLDECVETLDNMANS